MDSDIEDCMNVLHLTRSLAHGGRRQAILRLAELLPEYGVNLHIGALDEGGLEPHSVIDAEYFKRRSLLDRKAFGRLAAFCREHEIEVIHAHDAASQCAAAGLKAFIRKLQVVMTFHRSLGFESARRRDRIRNAVATSLCSAVITGSEERRRHFITENWVSARKVVRIPFGCNTQRFARSDSVRAEIRSELNIDDNTILLGAVGHFGEEKGVDRVLAAFGAMQVPANVPVALAIVGHGDEPRRKLYQEMAQVAAPGRIHFLGFRCDVERVFSALDVFVHAPRLEAFGLVLIEAMAAGLPVVATCTGGIPEIVQHDHTGLLADNDSPIELAQGMSRLAADAELRNRMGQAGRDVACCGYNLELYARRHVALYRRILGLPPSDVAVAAPRFELQTISG